MRSAERGGDDASTLAGLVARLPALGRRRAVGLHAELGLRWWTYERLHREACRVAGFLRDHGVGRGDRILLWAPNSPEWAAAFLGAALRGAVAVLVDSDVGADPVSTIATGEGCRLVLHGAWQAPLAATGGTVWAPVTAPLRSPEVEGLEAVRGDVRADDPLAVLYTSGTTAAPKGVLLSHRNVLCQVEPFLFWRRVLAWVPVRMLALPPASHVLGLVVGLVLPLSIGLSVVYTTGDRAASWARLIRDYRIAIALAVPRVLEALERRVLRAPLGRRQLPLDERLRRARLAGRWVWPWWARGEVLGRPRFRLFLVGGARLAPESTRFWRRAGVLVVRGYGLAETGAFVTISHPLSRGAEDVGRPVGAQRLRLADDGEILVCGPNLALGYRGLGVAAPLPAADGFLATGDLGRLDARGRLHVVGRKKDVVVTAEGFNVHPDDVELALGRQPGVVDAAVVSTAAGAGEEVHAVLRLAPGADPTAAVRGANAGLLAHERVRSWSVWPEGEELPRNRMGKVRRAEVAARLADLRAGAAPGVTPATLTIADVAREGDRRRRLELLARYVVQGGPGSEAADLRLVEDLGLGSLDVVELLGRVEGLAGPAAVAPSVARDATVATLRAQIQARVGADRAAGLPIRPSAWTLPLQLAQPLTRHLAIAAWALLNAVTQARWHADPRRIERPFILAAEPHRQSLDVFAVYRCLPWRLRRRLHLLVEYDFRDHFRPGPGTPPGDRLFALFGYYAALPSLFSFTALVPFGRTREALLEVGRRIDRGYSVMTFPDRLDLGVARLAVETGRPVLPVHLHSPAPLDWRWRRPRPRVTVHFGEPVTPLPDTPPAEFAAEVAAGFKALRAAARHGAARG